MQEEFGDDFLELGGMGDHVTRARLIDNCWKEGVSMDERRSWYGTFLKCVPTTNFELFLVCAMIPNPGSIHNPSCMHPIALFQRVEDAVAFAAWFESLTGRIFSKSSFSPQRPLVIGLHQYRVNSERYKGGEKISWRCVRDETVSESDLVEWWHNRKFAIAVDVYRPPPPTFHWAMEMDRPLFYVEPIASTHLYHLNPPMEPDSYWQGDPSHGFPFAFKSGFVVPASRVQEVVQNMYKHIALEDQLGGESGFYTVVVGINQGCFYPDLRMKSFLIEHIDRVGFSFYPEYTMDKALLGYMKRSSNPLYRTGTNSHTIFPHIRYTSKPLMELFPHSMVIPGERDMLNLPPLFMGINSDTDVSPSFLATRLDRAMQIFAMHSFPDAFHNMIFQRRGGKENFKNSLIPDGGTMRRMKFIDRTCPGPTMLVVCHIFAPNGVHFHREYEDCFQHMMTSSRCAIPQVSSSGAVLLGWVPPSANPDLPPSGPFQNFNNPYTPALCWLKQKTFDSSSIVFSPESPMFEQIPCEKEDKHKNAFVPYGHATPFMNPPSRSIFFQNPPTHPTSSQQELFSDSISKFIEYPNAGWFDAYMNQLRNMCSTSSFQRSVWKRPRAEGATGDFMVRSAIRGATVGLGTGIR